jgi:hypothetical protein
MCKTILINKNDFISNLAEIQGGAIAYRSYGPIDEDNSTIFENNTAGMHSPTISSYATQLNVTFDENQTTLTPL